MRTFSQKTLIRQIKHKMAQMRFVALCFSQIPLYQYKKFLLSSCANYSQQPLLTVYSFNAKYEHQGLLTSLWTPRQYYIQKVT